METSPFSFRRVRLKANGSVEGTEAAWKIYIPRRETRASPARRLNMAGVGALSRRLMAVERARALGRKPVDPRIYALEREASRWAEGKAGRKTQRATHIRNRQA